MSQAEGRSEVRSVRSVASPLCLFGFICDPVSHLQSRVAALENSNSRPGHLPSAAASQVCLCVFAQGHL